MTGRLAGKVAIVTGAGSGSGAATSRLFAAEGASVLAADINADAAAAVVSEIIAAGGTAAAHTVDLGVPDQVEAMVAAAVDEYGALHVLHNNASERSLVDVDNRVAEVDLDVWRRQFDVDLTAPMWAAKFAIPHMIAAGGGSIVNTSSLAARMAQDSRTAYGSAKSGLLGLSRAIAVQYGKDGVRSNVVMPGAIVTPTLEKLWNPEQLQIYKDHTMTPQLGTPEDIANTVLFLASDESRFITGQELIVDGGLSAFIAVVPPFRAYAERQAAAG